MIDLAGRVAIPGLNDAHMHLMMVGLGMQEVVSVPGRGRDRMAELLRRVGDAAKLKPPGAWVERPRILTTTSWRRVATQPPRS